MNKIIFLVGILFLGASPGFAQERVERQEHWPNAQTILRQFLDGENSVAIATAIMTCPKQNPYGDTLWVALLAMKPTPALVAQLGPTWSVALRTCNDPRIEAWYRARMLEARDLLSSGGVLLPLLSHRTPATVRLLKEVAFDSSRGEDLRNEILLALAWHWPWENRIELYLDAIARAEQIPLQYRDSEAWALINSPAADAFVMRALESIRQRPSREAGRLLHNLANYERVRETPALRGQVAETVRAIRQGPPGRYPAALVQAAVGAEEVLQRRSPGRAP
jgi:hypothetical protein